MEKKLFITKILNNRICEGYMEEGHHIGNEEELVVWFLSPERKCVWEKITDIEIKEQREGAEAINRTDLIMKVIKPRIFTVGEKVKAVYFDPLPGNKVAPPLLQEVEYTVKAIFVDSKGNQHLDLDIESEVGYVRSYETGEFLPDGDKIHWCHPGRVELA